LAISLQQYHNGYNTNTFSKVYAKYENKYKVHIICKVSYFCFVSAEDAAKKLVWLRQSTQSKGILPSHTISGHLKRNQSIYKMVTILDCLSVY
jgi:prophage tail gpP-like protein